MTRATNSPAATADHDDAEKPSFDLKVTNVAGGALAAVTTALAASFFGVTGTLVGAAFGSVLSSIAAAVYGHSLTTAKIKMRTTRAAILLTTPDGRAGSTPAPPVGAAPASAHRSSAPRPSWRPVALLAGVIFLVAMTAIWVTEIGIGHPVGNSAGKGTTSIGNVFHGGADSTASPSPSPGESASTTTGGRSASESGSPSTEVSTSPQPGDAGQVSPAAVGASAGAPTG